MKGTYVLIIRPTRECRVKAGGLGEIKLQDEAYAYVGSALKSLEKRIERHYATEKGEWWHIDYALKHAEITRVIYAESVERIECGISRELARTLPSVKGFGASDCKCESHLYHGESGEVTHRVIESFKKIGSKPMTW